MSDLYFDALDTYVDIKNYLDELNERSNYLVNDKQELAKVRDDIQLVSFLLEQITSITRQFFKEYHFKDATRTAETDYIAFLNSSLYKTIMSGSSLTYKAS